MPSTYQQLLYHVVFSTKNRKPYLTNKAFRTKLFSYMAGTAKNLEGFAFEIDGWIDNVHLLLQIPAKVAVSTFVGKLKANSSKHANESSGIIRKFAWQEGFGAFSVSLSQRKAVASYIQKQSDHHAKESLQDEYLRLLQKHEIDFDPRYIIFGIDSMSPRPGLLRRCINPPVPYGTG